MLISGLGPPLVPVELLPALLCEVSISAKGAVSGEKATRCLLWGCEATWVHAGTSSPPSLIVSLLRSIPEDRPRLFGWLAAR